MRAAVAGDRRMSLNSMTAFAREASQGPLAIVVELRSVNHRYLDCHFKLPDALRALEPRLREALTADLSRGKVDCQLRIDAQAQAQGIRIDQQRLAELADALREVRSACKARRPDALAVLQFPGVCDGAGEDEEALFDAAMATFRQALADLKATREREGAQLHRALRQRLDAIDSEVNHLRDNLPALRRQQEERLRRRLDELEQPVDPGRLEQELALALQKSDVDEELDRLTAHVAEVERVLARGGPCGRRLDFLMQELNREANTLGSKATATQTTQSAVELKVLIEQMREQVQNIE
jgi:uncharacterized protein (TIGR00255 family)